MSYLVTRRWLTGCESGNIVQDITDHPFPLGVYSQAPFDSFEVIAVVPYEDDQATGSHLWDGSCCGETVCRDMPLASQLPSSLSLLDDGVMDSTPITCTECGVTHPTSAMWVTGQQAECPECGTLNPLAV